MFRSVPEQIPHSGAQAKGQTAMGLFNPPSDTAQRLSQGVCGLPELKWRQQAMGTLLPGGWRTKGLDCCGFQSYFLVVLSKLSLSPPCL